MSRQSVVGIKVLEISKRERSRLSVYIYQGNIHASVMKYGKRRMSRRCESAGECTERQKKVETVPKKVLSSRTSSDSSHYTLYGTKVADCTLACWRYSETAFSSGSSSSTRMSRYCPPPLVASSAPSDGGASLSAAAARNTHGAASHLRQ